MADFDPVAASNSLGDEELKQQAARMRAVALPQNVQAPVRPVAAVASADDRKAMRMEPQVAPQPPSAAPKGAGPGEQATYPQAPKMPTPETPEQTTSKIANFVGGTTHFGGQTQTPGPQQEGQIKAALASQNPEDQRVQAAQAHVDELQNKKSGLASLIPITEGEGFGHRLLRIGEHIGRGVAGTAEGLASAVAPGIMMNIPGTNFNRAVRLQGAESGLEQAEKNRAESAQAEAERAKASGLSAQQKLNADMAAKDLVPVTKPDGTVTYQRINRDLTDEEFASKTPDQQVAYATYKAMTASTPEEKATWTQRADAAKAGANAKTAPPTKEGQDIAMQGLDQTLRTNPQGVSKDDRTKLAPYQRAQSTAKLDPEAMINTSGDYPVPASYDNGYADPKYQKDLNAWTAKYNAALAALPKNVESKGKADVAQTQAYVKMVRPNIQKDFDTSKGTLSSIDQAKTELNSGNAGQAAGVIKTLSALASGAGSGVRITGAELQMMIHNTRGLGADMAARWNKLVGGENIVLSSEQIQGFNTLLDSVKAHMVQKQNIADHQLAVMDAATTKAEAVQANNDFRKYMKAIETGHEYTHSEAVAYANSHYKGDMAAAEKKLKADGGVEVPE